MKTRELKFLVIVLAVFAVNTVFGQESVLYSTIRQAKESNVEFQRLPSVFVQESTPRDESFSSKFNNMEEVQFLTYDASKLTAIDKAIRLDIPFKNKNLSLELMEVPEAFYDYEVVTSSSGGKSPANRKFRHYRGIVNDDPNSLAAISFLEDEIMGLIATDDGNLVIGKESLYGKHLIYNDKNLKDKLDFECDIQDKTFIPYDPEMLLGIVPALSIKYVKFYVETEYDIYQAKGSVSAVESYMTGLFNQVATLYGNENIPVAISNIHIWTSTDPYTASNRNELLTQFENTRTSINGDLGILLTFRSEVAGGLAWIDGLCETSTRYKLGIAMIQSTYSVVPTYSWSVFVVTHEFGHLFGSFHTHDCVWNGNNTAIDGCGVDDDDENRTCPVPGIPSGGGTIMSYCHKKSVGINFTLGFGPQPGNVIRSRYNAAGCLSNVSISGPGTFPAGQQYASYSSLLSGTWSVTDPLSIYSGQGTNTVVLSRPDYSLGSSSTLSLIPKDSTSAYTISMSIYVVPDTMRSSMPDSIVTHLTPDSGIPNAVIEGIESESPEVTLNPVTTGSSDPAKFNLPLTYGAHLYNTLGSPEIQGETAGNPVYTLYVTDNRGNPPVTQHITSN